MPRKPRIHYTETDKALMWDRWRKGGLLFLLARLQPLDEVFPDIDEAFPSLDDVKL